MTISLVTGANGFIGKYLVNYLISRGDHVIELVKPKSDNNLGSAFKTDFDDEIKYENRHIFPVDILDSKKIKALIAEYRPNEIYHLAGQSSPVASWKLPARTMSVNYEGAINILEGVKESGLGTSIVMASSSSIYTSNSISPLIDESGECKPSTPYGISKLAVDHLANIYFKAHGLRVLNARPFFLIGPKKVGDVCSDWAKNIASIERGELDILSVGQVNGVVRDFLSIHDGVRGLALIASNGSAGESYNVCSGSGAALSDVLNILIKASTEKIHVSTDKSKIRPIDELVKVGDNKKLRFLGWNQNVSIENSLIEILEYWRNRNRK